MRPMTPSDLLHPTPAGLYCPPGDFFIDPVRQVDRAVITHGHADHARKGHGAVLATPETLAVMAVRYGENFTATRQPAAYGETTMISGVAVALIPAGHIFGSAQVVVEKDGLVIAVAGDFKRRADPTCAPFELPRAHVYVTEATFALPVFRHPDAQAETARLLASLRDFPERAHLVGAYSLGKAQRMIKLLRDAGYDDAIFVHDAVAKLSALYEDFGVRLGRLVALGSDAEVEAAGYAGRVVLAPPQSRNDAIPFADPLTIFCSGWMGVRKLAKSRGGEFNLVISDHADWDELTQTAKDIAPDDLWITHGREDALMRWAELNGMNAQALNMVGYENEGE